MLGQPRRHRGGMSDDGSFAAALERAVSEPRAASPTEPVALEKRSSWPSIPEAFFVLGCAVSVLGVAFVQIFVVMGVSSAAARPHFFVLPVLVGAFFGSRILKRYHFAKHGR